MLSRYSRGSGQHLFMLEEERNFLTLWWVGGCIVAGAGHITCCSSWMKLGSATTNLCYSICVCVPFLFSEGDSYFILLVDTRHVVVMSVSCWVGFGT